MEAVETANVAQSGNVGGNWDETNSEQCAAQVSPTEVLSDPSMMHCKKKKKVCSLSISGLIT